jgi:hypothetical protein
MAHDGTATAGTRIKERMTSLSGCVLSTVKSRQPFQPPDAAASLA